MPKILIVDDEPHVRLLLEQTLEELNDRGVDILTASDGESALRLIKEERPELVFLDVLMPNMDGFDVCTAVKKELCLDDVYIIMLTCKGQEFDRRRGAEVGADIYMTKPFNPDEVAAKAMEILGL
jgi:two-component system alkaline phosphatase synthesis response regulator PhoP